MITDELLEKYYKKFGNNLLDVYIKLQNKFRGMINRCYNKNNKDYKWYGGKGIKICDEWLEDVNKFYIFCLENITNINKMSIDRIDSSKGYSPDNCRFVSVDFNTRYIKGLERDKYSFSTTRLYYKCGRTIEYETIKSRIRNGWNEKDIIERPVKSIKITLKRLQQYINQNTCEKRFLKIYERFKKDNTEPSILKEGKKLYNDYIINCNKKGKLDYLENNE